MEFVESVHSCSTFQIANQTKQENKNNIFHGVCRQGEDFVIARAPAQGHGVIMFEVKQRGTLQTKY